METIDKMQTEQNTSMRKSDLTSELHIQIDEESSVSDTSVTQLTSSDCNSFINTQTGNYNTLTSLTTSETESETQNAQEKTLQASGSITEDSSESSGGSKSSESQNKNGNNKTHSSDSEHWYLHPRFKSYWKHYNYAMSWCQKHKSVVNHLRQKHLARTKFYSFPYNYPVSAYNYHVGQNHLYSGFGHGHGFSKKSSHVYTPYNFGNNIGRGRGRGVNNVKTSGYYSSNGETNTTNSSKDDSTEQSGTSYSDSEEFEMEITNEMLQFFAKSQKHREERDEKKLGPDGQEEKHVDVDSIKVNKKAPTSEAPKEQPGSRRTAEMLTLYGKGAAMIHGMETALQMTFDRNMDVKQPKIWPNMPLKLVFN